MWSEYFAHDATGASRIEVLLLVRPCRCSVTLVPRAGRSIGLDGEVAVRPSDAQRTPSSAGRPGGATHLTLSATMKPE